jgi:hypothetical protein
MTQSRLCTHIASMRTALRARWVLGIFSFALVGVSSTSAQRVRRTTVGRLLSARVDTIEMEHGIGGELGSRSAHLRLARTDSGFAGTLQLRAYRSPDLGGAAKRCDTTMTAHMAPAVARRLLALVDRAVIERGEAPEGPRVHDIQVHHWYRVAAHDESVVVRNGHAVEHRDVRYRAPLKRGPVPRDTPSWALIDQKASLMKAGELLQSYMQEERSIAFSIACQAG